MSRRASFALVTALALLSVGIRFALPRLGWSPLQTRALPGFTLGLPHGKALRDDHDYARGTFMVGVEDSDIVAGAAWAPSDGEPMSADDMAALLQVFAGGIGSIPKGKAVTIDVTGPDGKRLAGIHVGADLWSTLAMCGARQIVIITVGARGAEKLHRRVVRSFVCAPDAAEEQKLKSDGSALVLDLPGWITLAKTPDQLQLTDGNAVLLLQSIPSNIENTELQTVLGALMNKGGSTLTFSPPRDGRVAFTTTTGADTMTGWARVFHCGARSEAMMAIAASDAAAQAVWGRVANARCRRAGEPAQVWPGPPAH